MKGKLTDKELVNKMFSYSTKRLKILAKQKGRE